MSASSASESLSDDPAAPPHPPSDLPPGPTARQPRQPARKRRAPQAAPEPGDAAEPGSEDEEAAGGEGGAEEAVVRPKGSRGHAAEERERKRLRRLLRNRVSAQQARERKRVAAAGVEATVGELEHVAAALQGRLQAVGDENTRLRRALRLAVGLPAKTVALAPLVPEDFVPAVMR